MAASTSDPGRNRRLRVTYVALALWFVILAGIVSALAGSVAAGGIALGLFGLAFAASVLLMTPDLLPSGGLSASTRRRVRTSTCVAVAVVIATMVLVAVHEHPAVSLGLGVVAALASGGVALWAAVT